MFTAGPNAFFKGSANASYKPCKKLDAGVGFSLYHSITAMKEYDSISNEEIRLEDYNAACGLFGSKIAKLGMTVCVEPEKKLRPYEYGVQFQEAISSFIQKHGFKQENDKFNGLLRPSLASALKMQNEIKLRISGSTSKRQYTKIVVVGSGVNVDLVFESDSTIKEDAQPSQSPACDHGMKKMETNLPDSDSTSKTKTLSALKAMKESRNDTKRKEKPYLKSDHVSSPSQQINPTYYKRYSREFSTSNGNSSKRKQNTNQSTSKRNF